MKKTILVVDDIADNINVLKGILSSEGYSIKVANNGKRCLDIVKKNPKPDLILLDIMMPELDGFSVCEKLKADPQTKDIPVIFVTAKGEIEDEAYGLKLGAVDYLHKPISAPIVLARVKTHLTLTRIETLDKLVKGAITMLAEAGHYNDTDTGIHIWRMGAYAKAIALAIGWDEEEANELELAATMHDTGKIGIKDSILKAPRRLSDEEWIEMKRHSQIGYDILFQADNKLFQLSATIALHHHEKWDGSGYPHGLAGEKIPISARITAIADVFDALTVQRPYKEAWSLDDSFAEIEKNSGTHFDPQLVKTFFSIKDEILVIKKTWDKKELGV